MSRRSETNIALCVGEASGDLLGAGLISGLRDLGLQSDFYGIAGPNMIAQGCTAWQPMDKLSVMGFSAVLRRLPELLAIRRKFIQDLKKSQPSVFVGIDAPDFNLAVEQQLKSAGIPTVHYVSPTVWAWRQSRVKILRKSVDLLLTLFPFEQEYLQQNAVPSVYVGHPAADRYPLHPDKIQARIECGLPLDRQVVALLPGSRKMEIQQLGRIYLQTAALLHKQHADIQFVIPAATAARAQEIQKMRSELFPELPLTLLSGQASTVLMAADAALVTSGTATLEAALAKCPMLVCYRMTPFNWWLAKHFVQTKFIALPNLVADAAVVPEYIQDDVRVDVLAAQLLNLLNDRSLRQTMQAQYEQIHLSLRQDANKKAAEAVAGLLQAL